MRATRPPRRSRPRCTSSCTALAEPAGEGLPPAGALGTLRVLARLGVALGPIGVGDERARLLGEHGRDRPAPLPELTEADPLSGVEVRKAREVADAVRHLDGREIAADHAGAAVAARLLDHPEAG